MHKKSQRGRPAIQGLTPAQERCLKKVCDLIDTSNGIPPTVQELATELDLVPATIHGLLKQLISKGFLKRIPGQARGLYVLKRLANKPSKVVHIPILGEVVAGRPLLSEECCLGDLAVESSMVQHGKYFALRIKGDSMRDVDMHPGDYVIVRHQQLAESGDIVVATIDGEATVKRLKMQPDGSIFLMAENPKYRPIPVTPDTPFQLLGKVVATSQRQGGS